MLQTHQIEKLKKGKQLLALSGGVDSVVLFDLLIKNKILFQAAHVNFNLRGKDADADQFFVEELCHKHKIKLHFSSCNTKELANEKRQSIQLFAREFRYAFFDEILKKNSFSYLLTAHHLEDQLETFLINLSRGTGLAGLRGISNDKIIRPLLHLAKDEIYNYAESEQLEWREDKSNAEDKYLRNFIRNTLISRWKEKSPDLLKGFYKTIGFLSYDYQILVDYHQQKFKELVKREEKGVLYLELSEIRKKIDNETQLFWWFSPFGFSHPIEISKILKSDKSKEIQSETHRLIVGKNELILSKIDLLIPKRKTLLIENIEHFSILGWKYELSDTINQKARASFDLDTITFPLVERNIEKGDVFVPFGMKGKKKITKFLKDLGKSKLEKEKQRLLVDGKGEILWVIDERISQLFLVTDISKRILNIY